MLGILLPMLPLFALGAVATAALHLLQRDLQSSREGPPLSLEGKLMPASTRAMRDVAAAVSAGFFVVLIAQVVLRTWFPHVAASDVGHVESHLRGGVEMWTKALSPPVLVAATLFFLLISLEYPRTRAIKRWAGAKKWIGFAGIVLSTTTSFTFVTGVVRGLSPIVIQEAERDWVARHCSDADRLRGQVAEYRRNLVAKVAAKRTLEALSHHTRYQIADSLWTIWRRTPSEAKDRANEFGAGMVESPGPQPGPDGNPGGGGDRSSPRGKLPPGDGSSGAAPERRAPVPDFAELRSLREERDQLSRGLRDANKAVELLADELAGHIWPHAVHELVKPFVEGLASAIASTLVEVSLPKDVHDLATAELWLRLHMPVPRASWMARDQDSLPGLDLSWRVEEPHPTGSADNPEADRLIRLASLPPSLRSILLTPDERLELEMAHLDGLNSQLGTARDLEWVEGLADLARALEVVPRY